MDQKKPHLVTIQNARSEHQKKVMEQIIADDVCPFCIENLTKYHKNPILKEGKFWLLTDNQWPYKNINHQLLAIYKTHIEHLNEMDPESAKELLEFFQEISRERKIPGGAVAIRFGSNELGNYGSSVKHIHAHLIEPNLANEEKTAVKFKIGEPWDRKDK